MSAPKPADVILDLEPMELRVLICNRAYAVNQMAMSGGTKMKMLTIATRCVELIAAMPDDPKETK